MKPTPESYIGGLARIIRPVALLCACWVLQGLQLAAHAQDMAQPPANLVVNPNFNSARHWQLEGGARLDSAHSKSDDGSAAIVLGNPVPMGSVVRSSLIPVSGGRQYTFSYYMKTLNGPTYAGAQVSIHRPDGSFIRNLASSRGGTTEDGLWQEFVWPVFVPDEASYVRVEAYKHENTRPGGTVWVDELLFTEGLVFREPPAEKQAFNGGRVRVDALGNFETRRQGQWQPFFPLGIFSSNHRDWRVYSEQGWNTIMWTSNAEWIAKARDAVSEFNPEGMMAGFMIAQYTHPDGWAYNDTRQLDGHISSIHNQGLFDNLLFYFWDNELHNEQWQVPKNIINTIRAIETRITGEPQFPVVALQGQVNLARVHAAAGLVDVSGAYYHAWSQSTEEVNARTIDVTTSLKMLDRIQGQSSPAALAQLNGVNAAGDMRLRIYNALTAGAKAVGYWRDCVAADCQGQFPDVGAVDKKPWSADLPLLREELDLLLPIIRQPHQTDWQVELSPQSNAVHVGTRDFNGKRIVFVINQTSEQQKVTLSIPPHRNTDAGTGNRPAKAKDFFTGDAITIEKNGDIRLELAPIDVGKGTCVLVIY